MTKEIRISDSEMELMELIWTEDTWISISQLAEKLDKKWKCTTVATFVNRLKNKGYLETKKEGNVNVYRPLLSKEDYKAQETREFLNTVHHGSPQSLIASLCRGKVNKQDFDELMQWLDKME